MPSDSPTPAGRPSRPDTKRTAPRRLLMFIIPLALAALVILLIAIRHIGHVT